MSQGYTKKDSAPSQDENNTIELNNNNSYSFESNSYNSYVATKYFSLGLNIFDCYSDEAIINLVKDPIGNNEELRKVSRILYACDGTVTNTIDYMTAMPTLDRVLVPFGKKNKKEKKKNSDLVESALNTIRDKEFIRDVLRRGMIDGIAFYYMEVINRPSIPSSYNDFEVDSIVEINDVGLNVAIISLPTDYCRIVGLLNGSYMVAFNLDYFKDYNGESLDKKLKKFPKEIRDAYKNKEKSKSPNNWIVLNNDHTIVHKIRSDRNEKWGRPLCLAAIKDILYNDYFTNTKRNVLDDINNRIVYQILPEGEKKGSCSLSKTQQEMQHEKVKSAILHKNSRGGTSVITVSAGTKLDTLDPTNTDIFDSKNEEKLKETIALDLGIAGGLLNGSGSGNYSSQEHNIELMSAEIFQWIESIQYELNKCLTKLIVRDTKNRVEVNYLPITHVNKKSMVNFAKELYTQGKGSISFWAACVGISPTVFFEMVQQERDAGWDEIQPHQTSYTMSTKKGEVGAPTKDDSTNPNTLKSRANGANQQARTNS